MIFSVCANFCEQTHCRNSVFITHKVFCHESITLFTTTNILFNSFEFSNLSSNPFEASETVYHLNIVLISNLLDKFCCYNSFHNEVVRLHFACLYSVGNDVIKEDKTCLVTIDKYPFTFIILTSHTYSVCIWV